MWCCHVSDNFLIIQWATQLRHCGRHCWLDKLAHCLNMWQLLYLADYQHKFYFPLEKNVKADFRACSQSFSLRRDNSTLLLCRQRKQFKKKLLDRFSVQQKGRAVPDCPACTTWHLNHSRYGKCPGNYKCCIKVLTRPHGGSSGWFPWESRVKSLNSRKVE